MKSFVGKWWIVRCLHRYIYKGSTIRKEMGSNQHHFGDIVTGGVNKQEFSDYMFFIIFIKGGLNKLIFWFIRWTKDDSFIFMDIDNYVKQAKEADYINETLDHKLLLTNTGNQIYVWYYPVLQFLTVTLADTNIKSLIIAGGLFWLITWLSKIKWLWS